MVNLERYLIMAMLIGYVGKLLAFGAGFADMGIVLVLAAAHFLYNSQLQNKEIVKLKQELKEAVSSFKNENLRIQAVVDEHRTSLTSIKMSQGIRNVK